MYYTTKSASKFTGATIRQLQYWRLKELVVPTVNALGTGHTMYYSRADLFKIKVVLFILNQAYNFKVAANVLQTVNFAQAVQVTGKVMFLLEPISYSGNLAVFDRQLATSRFLAGEIVILIDLDDLQLEIDRRISSPNQQQ